MLYSPNVICILKNLPYFLSEYPPKLIASSARAVPHGDAARVHEVPSLGPPLAPPLPSLPIRRAAS